MHLFVGDITKDTAQAAQAVSADAYIITQENCQNDHTGVAYVSLGDLNNEMSFCALLRRADKITLVDKHIWSDGKSANDPYSMAWHTVNYIKILEAKNKFVPTARPGSQPCIWLAGCSTTAGEGLTFPEQRYGFLIAQQLDLELVDMSETASSIQWSAERILHSDIQANDIVIWGLTGTQRLPYYHNNQLYHIHHSTYQTQRKWLQNYISIDELASDNLLHHNLQSIRSVENFCNKIDAKLVKASIHCPIDVSVVCADDNFVFIHGENGSDTRSSFLDASNDDWHPGPLTHKMYAKRILEHLEKRHGT